VTTDSNTVEQRKKTEAETLATFQEELPSQYFSHKGEEEYRTYTKKAEAVYRDLFKFPPKMFDGASLIDFGAGTGENTIYLANWGANCTLVEMNNLAQNVSKEVFAKFAKAPDDHSFVNCSIFDYIPDEPQQYDIVHCRGVLSHTAAKEQAFRKISSYVKPGGFLIFGDPNKAGGFQNMLQRFAVYAFASTPDEMVDVSEELFKEDIDRSEATIPRTRRAIIFDRWVIQSQDDPSVGEVLAWVNANGLNLYSCYPPVLPALLGDSLHHTPAFDSHTLGNLIPLAELVWMMQTESDSVFLEPVNNQCEPFADAFKSVTSYVENLNKTSEIDLNVFDQQMSGLSDAFSNLSVHASLQKKLITFSKEAVDFVKAVKGGDLKAVRNFIVNAEHLFKGACGNRHVDFIAYKPAED
jgi:2-polyprenyl-3-methyl-5-hydroxy-6-metoxy-1,4-benzoquinol methylase